MSSIYYNPLLTLQILESISTKPTYIINKVFNLLFEKLNVMTRDCTERLVVLSFTTLFSVPQTILPDIIRNNLPSMFQQILRELVLIEEEALKEDEDGDDDDQGGANEDEAEEEEDEGDDDNDDDEAMEGNTEKGTMMSQFTASRCKGVIIDGIQVARRIRSIYPKTVTTRMKIA
jgi:cation transport regulator ChaB